MTNRFNYGHITSSGLLALSLLHFSCLSASSSDSSGKATETAVESISSAADEHSIAPATEQAGTGSTEANLNERSRSSRTDFYSSLDELKKDCKQDVDYRIRSTDRKSRATIVSPHGGNIEIGTSELAEAIAHDRYNLFDFAGLRPGQGRKTHVTSSHFRDPVLQRLLGASEVCIAIHGMKGTKDLIYSGGLNAKLKRIITEKLQAAGFDVNANPPRLTGADKDNFVNLPTKAGVQLELSRGLREKLMTALSGIKSGDALEQPDAIVFVRFVEAVRAAIEEYLTNQTN